MNQLNSCKIQALLEQKKQKFRRFQTHKKFPIYLLGTEDYTYGIYLDSYEMHEAIGTFGGKLI
jgi:hypothetical protein